jgi:hypothetical protein
MEEALRLGTQDALLHFHAAALFSDVGQNDRAASELSLAFEINPYFSVLHQAEAVALATRLGVALPDEVAR